MIQKSNEKPIKLSKINLKGDKAKNILPAETFDDNLDQVLELLEQDADLNTIIEEIEND